jgi:DNA-binding IclR family transcriptional regulator
MSSQTERCFRIFEELCKHALDGVSNKELAARLQTSPANVCRDVDLLISLGMAQRLDNGRYAVTVKPLSLLRLVQLHIAAVTDRAEQLDRSINARAMQMHS